MDTEDIQQEFAQVQKRWSKALQQHRMAPPDLGFARRLSELADVLRAEAVICRRGAAAGLGWPPHKADTPPPYELQPGTGRRGAAHLWQRFDAALDQLNRAVGNIELEAVADAFEELGNVTAELAVAVAREDAGNISHPSASEQRRRDAGA